MDDEALLFALDVLETPLGKHSSHSDEVNAEREKIAKQWRELRSKLGYWEASRQVRLAWFKEWLEGKQECQQKQ